MRKIKILGIAPYDGIADLMRQTAAKREDIALEVFVGDLQAGAAISSRYADTDLDVIISRGGTAELIRQTTSFPVVDIPLSIYDIFRSIKLAESYTDKYALVGFPAITRNAHFLCDMLQYRIDIYTIHNQDEAARVLQMLLESGCHMVLCDMITNSLAKQYGLSSILIASGTESIETAFDAAVQIAHSCEQLKADLTLFKTVLNNHPWPVIVFLPDGKPVFYTEVSDLTIPVMDTLRENIPAVMENGEKKIYCERGGLLYVLHGYRRELNGKTWIFYYINHRKVPLALTKNGIRYLSKEEAFDIFSNSFYGLTHAVAQIGMTIDDYAQSSAPLVILGEPGTAKEALARLLYSKSRLQNKPMAIIDFARIGDKSWTFLTEHDNSPLSDTNTTIYLKNVSSLTDPQFQELLSIISDLNLTAKNRLLFTFRREPDGLVPPRCQRILDGFSCLRLDIAPLRTHLSDIPNLASLYINTLNIRLSKEVVGIEPEGIRQMQSYSWPGNYDQFQRIMNELVAVADSPYIRTADVIRLLQRELPAAPASSALRLDRTLEEINLDIVRLVLGEEQGNQSAVAKRLGISRTTLWRMMQKIK